MATARLLRPAKHCLRSTRPQTRSYASQTTEPLTSPFAPRHLLSIADLTPAELTTLVRNASKHKQAIKSHNDRSAVANTLLGQTIAVMFTKRSTRTRVSTEGAVALMNGHPMFLGAQDIQLGVNESLYDTSLVISSMVAGIVARVNAHKDVADLAKHSTVPVINALSDGFHPLQTIADYLTVHEAFSTAQTGHNANTLGLEGLKIAWVGDANNVLFDLAIGAAKLGVNISVATPKGYEIPSTFRDIITASHPASDHSFLTETNVPEEAVKDADIIVTDTWVSMGQEEESAKRLKAFEGFQVTKELAKRGGAKEGWKFMHCLPRHPEEVSDEVFYSPASLVFQEAENRLWSALAVLEAFVVNKGKIL
jgi:ornithine carbamoyltransferase